MYISFECCYRIFDDFIAGGERTLRFLCVLVDADTGLTLSGLGYFRLTFGGIVITLRDARGSLKNGRKCQNPKK